MRRLLLAHCVSSYLLFAVVLAASWTRDSGPVDARMAVMVPAAPLILPLQCTLGLWNRYGIRWPNAILACAHVGVTAAGYLIIRRAHARRERQRVGLCPTCGYDVRASPDRCPECGAATPQSRPAWPENSS